MAFQDFCTASNIDIFLTKNLQLTSHEIIEEILKNGLHEFQLNKDKKSDQVSELYREKGNVYFNNNDENINQIYLLYTQALFNAETKLEKSYCFGNRSSVFFKKGLYTACINDINNAISMNYPKDKEYKILLRKGEALVMLGEYMEAKQCFLDAKSNLESVDKVPKMWQQRIWLGLEKCISKEKYNTYNRNINLLRHYPTDNIEITHNNNIHAFSEDVCLRVSDDDGRGIFATKDIEIGKVIGMETPYTYRLSTENMFTHCYYCLQANLNLMPCDNCCQVGFCNEQCQKFAQTENRHDLECGIISEILSTYSKELGLLAYGIISRADQKIIHSALDLLEDNSLKNEKIIINSDDYLSALAIETNELLRSSQDLGHRCLSSVFLAHCLLKMSFNYKDCESEVEWVKTLSRSLCKHLQGIPCNAHSLAEHTTPLNGSLIESTINYIGNALYPALSMINHSCCPNVVRITLSKGVCILKTCSRIAKGEQIFDNYSIHYATMPINERCLKLREQYYFDCQCVACKGNWATFEEQLQLNNTAQFQCPKCRETVTDQNPICQNCQLNLTEVFDKFHILHGHLSKNMDMILKGKLDGVETYLLEFCSLLCDFVKSPNVLFHQTGEMIKLIWTLGGVSVNSF